jgi:hypothetical protein
MPFGLIYQDDGALINQLYKPSDRQQDDFMARTKSLKELNSISSPPIGHFAHQVSDFLLSEKWIIIERFNRCNQSALKKAPYDITAKN